MRIKPKYDVKVSILAFLRAKAGRKGRGATRGEIKFQVALGSTAAEIQGFLDALCLEGIARASVRRDRRFPGGHAAEYFAVLKSTETPAAGHGRGVRMGMIRVASGKELRR